MNLSCLQSSKRPIVTPVGMVKEAITKIGVYKQRHIIYLPVDLIEDSLFPFQVGEPLKVKIVGSKLIIVRATVDS